MKPRDCFLFLFYLLLVLIFYFPTRQAGFVTDFYGWQEKFIDGSFKDVLHTFGWHANQQVSVFFFYILYSLFDVNGWGWYLTFSLLHALNGWMCYELFRRLFVKFSLKNSSVCAFIGTLLFLFSPYQAEVLVWRVCIHYLLSAFCILFVLSQTVNFLETGNKKYLWWIQGVFFISLFTLEITLITPVLIIVFVLFWNTTVEKRTPLNSLAILAIPQFLFIGSYFLLNKLLLGEWVGHYGAATHFNISFHDIFSNYFRYFIKYLFFTRYFDHPVKMKIFGVAENSVGIYLLLTLFVLLFITGIVFYRRLSKRLRMAGLSLLLFFAALTPVITLYMVTLMYGENDRYGYLASIFFWMMISVLLGGLSRKFYYPLATILLGVSVFLLLKTNNWWAEDSRIYNSLLNDFRWYDKDEVIVLNIPDNYRGLYMFRIYNEPSGLKEGLEFIRKKPFNGEMHEVTQWNMMNPGEGVSVVADSINHLTVTLNQWGNWWWWEGIGNSDYENEKYKVRFDGNSYHLQLKSLKQNHAIIYQVGDKWKEIIEN
jgi:hypothetical protein